MTTISAAAVNELRKRTDMPLMDCKKALTESAGDMEKAVEWLRSQNSKVRDKRGANETAEGRVSVFIDTEHQVAGIVELRCESAPVVKSEHFMGLGTDLAKQVATTGPANVETLLASAGTDGKSMQDRINEVIGLIRENMKPQRFQKLAGGVFGEYIHHDGTLGVLIQLAGTGGNAEVLRDICAHIAAMNPPYAKLTDVPVEILSKEKELATAQVQQDPKNVGKPTNILEKIVEGKVKTWASENVLLEQPIANQAKYDKKTVGQLIAAAKLELTSFVRYKVGEISA
ncbi:MAG: translation elongation factor Ts [Gemmataceae bacterium]